MSDLASLTKHLSGKRIAVIGDVMLDHFIVGRIDRISPEAPVPVVRFNRDEFRLGGAANVAQNIRALGGVPTLVGLVGADEPADRLRAELTAGGVDFQGLISDAGRPTTKKVRVVTPRRQQIARLDYEEDVEPDSSIHQQLCEETKAAVRRADAVVLSDYRKGVITSDVIACAIAAAQQSRVPLLVDPKVPEAERYKGATLITPNHHEAELMARISIRTPDDARRAAQQIHERSGSSVLITWGENGMWLHDRADGRTVEEHLPAAAREVADVTGAGDTVIATLALALAAGARLSDAARLANLTAGLVVAKFGPAVVAPEELMAAIRSS